MGFHFNLYITNNRCTLIGSLSSICCYILLLQEYIPAPPPIPEPAKVSIVHLSIVKPPVIKEPLKLEEFFPDVEPPVKHIEPPLKSVTASVEETIEKAEVKTLPNTKIIIDQQKLMQLPQYAELDFIPKITPPKATAENNPTPPAIPPLPAKENWPTLRNNEGLVAVLVNHHGEILDVKLLVSTKDAWLDKVWVAAIKYQLKITNIKPPLKEGELLWITERKKLIVNEDLIP